MKDIENNTQIKDKALKNPQKGQYGYIDYSKKKALIASLLSLTSVLIIFFTGVIIYHSNKSLFSIIAAVASLPAAKLITSYIVRLPYKTGNIGLYDKLKEKVAANNEYKALIGADFIISSNSKSMEVTFAYIVNGKVICYTANNKTNAKETEKYIKEVFDNESTQYSQIKVYNDENKFLKNVNDVCMDIGKEYTDKRIFEKLCAYSM